MTDTPGTLEERQNDKPPTHWHPDSKSELQPQSEGEWDWREDRHDNDALGRSKRRLRFAWCLADPHAPDQMALVLRVDLGRVLAKLTQYTAHREMLMKSKTEAADEIASLRARVEALETALVSEREENLWHAYHSGFVRNGEWDHMCMSDGEWLAMECGFNVNDRRIADADIRAAIPQAARQALKDTPVE